jgi:prepilin-type N-terminal cleavage/methylation domain-containing protein
MRSRGFSLVELSIVVLIIGIVMTMGIGAWTANLENQAFSATAQRHAAIKDALTGYIRRNNRLPCPDTDFTAPDGVENRTTAGNPATACSARFGILPYVTLGLARDAVRDGWGNFFSYHVSNTAGGITDWTLTATFYTGNTGIITVNDRNGVTVTPLATNVVAVVVSHGRNGFGAYGVGGTRNSLPAAGTDELDNTNGTADTVYFRREITTSDAATGGAFDDQVLFLAASDLLDPLFRDGTLKSPQAAVQELLQKQKQLLIGYSMGYLNPSYGGGGCTDWGFNPRCRVVLAADTADGYVDGGNSNANGLVPYLTLGLALSSAIDPWGSRLRYTLDTTVIYTDWGGGMSSSYPAASTVAMTLTSRGPDRADGGGDDISLQITVGEIRASMIGLLP